MKWLCLLRTLSAGKMAIKPRREQPCTGMAGVPRYGPHYGANPWPNP
ncbi:MAG: hypothetical protein ACLQBD_07705 [Syntrophobacteraceae bacterium]